MTDADPRAPTWERMKADRDRAVLDAACRVAETHGLQRFTRAHVALSSGKAPGTVSLAFGSMDALRDAVVREAIRRPLLTVLAQALAMGHPVARDAPEDLRAQALAAVN
jgi:AcrR family transcriptional regulator